jgi:flavin-dependent thymidylate synthase
MKVTIVNETQLAHKMLILAKSTRLEMNEDLLLRIHEMSPKQLRTELEYVANTIKSNWEFVDYTVLVEGISRNCMMQVLRTRTNSYSQQTMRVTNQSNYDFIMPDRINENPAAKSIVDSVNSAIKQGYEELLDLGISNEDARCILPGNIATNCLIKINLRTLSDLVATRTGGRTQGEYRKLMDAIVCAVLTIHPWAEMFLFNKPRDYFKEIEDWAAKEISDFSKRSEILKIVDKMRQEAK